MKIEKKECNFTIQLSLEEIKAITYSLGVVEMEFEPLDKETIRGYISAPFLEDGPKNIEFPKSKLESLRSSFSSFIIHEEKYDS